MLLGYHVYRFCHQGMQKTEQSQHHDPSSRLTFKKPRGTERPLGMQAGRMYFSSSCELTDVCLGSIVPQCSASRKERASIKRIGTSMFLFLSHTSIPLAWGLLHGQTKEVGEKTSSEGTALLPQASSASLSLHNTVYFLSAGAGRLFSAPLWLSMQRESFLNSPQCEGATRPSQNRAALRTGTTCTRPGQ